MTPVFLAAVVAARANMFDVFEQHKLFPKECEEGCAPWAEVAAWREETKATDIRDIYASFADGKVPADAANLCAMPGMSSPQMAGNSSWVDHVQSGYAGSFCYCEDKTKRKDEVGRYAAAYCRAALGVPEQINLQIASATTVVAGFVTFERAFPVDPPVAEISKVGTPKKQLTGVSHWYVEKAGPNCDFPNTNPCTEGRNCEYSEAVTTSLLSLPVSHASCAARSAILYASSQCHHLFVADTMSFVKFTGLEPGQNYSYRVKSGAVDGKWSDTFVFRAAQPNGGASRLAVYGDMGIYGFNNMANLKKDCEEGIIDAIVHMGDHVYFWEDGDNRRGDAYMNAFQPTLSSCPWMPILGK